MKVLCSTLTDFSSKCIELCSEGGNFFVKLAGRVSAQRTFADAESAKACFNALRTEHGKPAAAVEPGICKLAKALAARGQLSKEVAADIESNASAFPVLSDAEVNVFLNGGAAGVAQLVAQRPELEKVERVLDAYCFSC